MNARNTPKQTAAECYARRSANVDRMLSKLTAAVAAHKARAGADSKNWGFAGDLDYVEATLAEALRAMGDDSELLVREASRKSA